MERFAGWVVRARQVIVGLVVVLTALAGWCVARYSRVEADISKYLPPRTR